MRKILSISLIVLSLSPLANAAGAGGLFVEPMITYERGEGDVDFPDPLKSSSTDVDGFGVGARLGIHIFE